MALSKLLAASLCVSFLLLFLLHLSDADQSVSEQTPQQVDLIQQIDCNRACGVRCSKSSRPHICERACGACCRRCNCVPPGTSGNQRACPCYYNQTTHDGRRKCP